MPPPRRRDRRSRSRSISPRNRRRSRSHSRGKRRSRSRTPPRKRSRSPQRRARSPPRQHSPPRQRSPPRPQHRRSRSPARKPARSRSSSSSGDRNYPVKRQADSSGKRHGGYGRSRSPSPVQLKRVKEEPRRFREESPVERKYSETLRQRQRSHSPRRRSPSPRRRSPSPRRRSPSPYESKMYADQASTSKRPLFPVKKDPNEIDLVRIIDLVPKEKLNKRFRTLEQISQGPFEFEENISIGIHRGPSHMELDEDIPVNYEFNSKTFLMIFPKKDYAKTIFDRDEIKAFRHDDILDEEAYVEKRTINVKPMDKPKKKYGSDMDYKITVGSGDRDSSYGDRRMVQDSGSRSRPSRTPGYEPDVRVRLDPRPDARYEKLYREQQRQDDQSLIQEKIHRNPNDLRYNLMRRKDDDPRDRGSDRGREDRGRDMVDARSRLDARRGSDRDVDRRDRPRFSRDSPPPRSAPEKRKAVKTDLPDFKNRPDKFQYNEWEDKPEVVPKGNYYEHDSRARDDMTFWERKLMFQQTGKFPGGTPRGRGRGGVRGFVPRGRGGITRGYTRGGYTPQTSRPGFTTGQGYRKPWGSNMDEWKHDKFSEIADEENTNNNADDNNKDKSQDSSSKDRKKDKKDGEKSHKKSHKDKSHSKKDSGDRKKHSNIEKGDKEANIMNEEEALNTEINVEVTG